MSAVGIIAEYNPFHNGHAYHIKRAKEESGAENAIVCMSASFTQRGEPACLDKFARARHALLGGADMVIELPDILSCACAERFAYGGVRLLSATGLVNALAFGSECGDLLSLKKAAELDFEGEEFKALLSKGLSYPNAAALALKERGVSLNSESPNDVLAIEYIRQLNGIAPEIEPIAVKRAGSGYNDLSIETEFASASALRSAASDTGSSLDALSRHIPDAVFKEMMKMSELGRFPASLDALSPAILFALRSMGAAERIGLLADVSEGLENPIYKAALSSSSCSELLDKVKTKRYTMARLKRILMYALLGTTAEMQTLAFEKEDALYIRVLAVKKNKLRLLSELSECASLPVIVSAADLRKLGDNAALVLEHARRASLIHALAFPTDMSCADDFSSALITV